MNVVEVMLVRKVSRIGGTKMADSVPIGKVYRVDIDSLGWGRRLDFETGKETRELCVIDVDTNLALPADCFGIGSESTETVN